MTAPIHKGETILIAHPDRLEEHVRAATPHKAWWRRRYRMTDLAVLLLMWAFFFCLWVAT